MKIAHYLFKLFLKYPSGWNNSQLLGDPLQAYTKMGKLLRLFLRFKNVLLEKYNCYLYLAQTNNFSFYVEYMEHFSLISNRKILSNYCIFFLHIAYMFYSFIGIAMDTYNLSSEYLYQQNDYETKAL